MTLALLDGRGRSEDKMGENMTCWATISDLDLVGDEDGDRALRMPRHALWDGEFEADKVGLAVWDRDCEEGESLVGVRVSELMRLLL